MNYLCFFWIFNVDNSKQKLWTCIEHLKLGFGLLMNSWIVSVFKLVHQRVDDRNELLRLAQEYLIFHTWSIYELLQGVNDKRKHGEGSVIREHIISYGIDNVSEAHYDLIYQINRSDFLLIFEILFVSYLFLQENLRWFEAILTQGIQKLQQSIHFFWLPSVHKLIILVL